MFEYDIKNSGSCQWIKDYLTPVENFPKQGITFQWYANLLHNPMAFRAVIDAFSARYANYAIDSIAALDSRGFIFGATLAYVLKIPFIMIRKSGKLPRPVQRMAYELEYNSAAIEIETESVKPNDRVLIIDDILATGGTIKASCDLLEKLDAEVIEVTCLIELSKFAGKNKFKPPVYSLLILDN